MKLCFEAVGLLVHRDRRNLLLLHHCLNSRVHVYHSLYIFQYVRVCLCDTSRRQRQVAPHWPFRSCARRIHHSPRRRSRQHASAYAQSQPPRARPSRLFRGRLRRRNRPVRPLDRCGPLSGSTTTPSRRRRAVTLRTCSSTSPTRSPCSVTRISSGTVTSSAGATTTTSSMTTDLTTPRFCASP